MMRTAHPNLTAVAIRGRGVIIEGPPGSGKSALALALIDRGASLIGDDGLELSVEAGRIVAHPPGKTSGKIEIRNVGLVSLPCTSALVALILSLTEDAPRFADRAESRILLGCSIPAIAFRAGDAVQAIRAEYALLKYGLPPNPLGSNLRTDIA